jgi:hypothetical protein
MGRGENLRVAGSVAAPEQGLCVATRDGRGLDLWCDEPLDTAQAGAGGVKMLHSPSVSVSPFAKLALGDLL